MTSSLFIYRTKSSPNGVYSYRKAFAPMGANAFLYEITPIYKTGNDENDRVSSPEGVPILLK